MLADTGSHRCRRPDPPSHRLQRVGDAAAPEGIPNPIDLVAQLTGSSGQLIGPSIAWLEEASRRERMVPLRLIRTSLNGSEASRVGLASGTSATAVARSTWPGTFWKRGMIMHTD